MTLLALFVARTLATGLLLSPVNLDRACKSPSIYCVYVDQVFQASVDISEYYASDNQGGFAFEKSLHQQAPIQICYGGCCVEILTDSATGCVKMSYVNLPVSIGTAPRVGHLLAHFAENRQYQIGPRSDMLKVIQACPQGDNPAPYAVVQPRFRKGSARARINASHSAGSSPGPTTERSSLSSGSHAGLVSESSDSSADPASTTSDTQAVSRRDAPVGVDHSLVSQPIDASPTSDQPIADFAALLLLT
ncbi:hypothetical protein BCV70DRAFT_161525 [Testicularia cyperi]|uniref:Uncharacterized protein n=1 Tax=Testicularia cyperi TaxID=1882483 RepID=A0A317XPG6_9BASI|nr:hypothetical protein BCV70DRAFT_161525 [Testicularia cyperi]